MENRLKNYKRQPQQVKASFNENVVRNNFQLNSISSYQKTDKLSVFNMYLYGISVIINNMGRQS